MPILRRKSVAMFFLEAILTVLVHSTQDEPRHSCYQEPEKVNRNTRLNGDQFRIITGIGKMDCWRKCVFSGSCMSVNYNLRNATCEMNLPVSAYTVNEFSQKWENFHKDDLLKVVSGPCANNSCPKRTTCVTVGPEGVKCFISECEYPTNLPPNMEFTGMSRIIPVGTTVNLGCTSNYRIAGDRQITCQAIGNFTDIDFECEYALCPAPSLPDIPNTGYPECTCYPCYYIGCGVYFTCNEGFKMNSDGIGMIICLDNRTWSTFSFSCVPEIIECSFPTLPTDVQNYGSYVSTCGIPIPVNCTIEFKCKENYTVNLDGVNMITCLDNGNWSEYSFSCIAEITECPFPATLPTEVSHYHAYNFTCGTPIPIGCTIDFLCEEGYTVNSGGTNFVTCQNDGTWTAYSFLCVSDDLGT